MQSRLDSLPENDLIQSLQSMIATYLSRNSSLTINALSQRASIPVTTLRRLTNGEQKSEIAPHSVLNLSSYIHREKNLTSLLEKVDPVIGQFLHKHFGSFIFSPETKAVYEVSLNEELVDRVKYFIYKLAANHDGVDWVSVIDSFGPNGKKKAEDLKKKGLLIESEGRLHAKDKNFSLDLHVAVRHLPELISFYRPETITRGRNSFFSLSEALNEKAIEEIRSAQRECVKKIHSIMSDQNNLGDIPYFTINLAETLTAENPTGEIQ